MHSPGWLEGQTHRQTICNFTGIICQSSSSSRAAQSSVSALIITHGNEGNPSPLSQCTFSAERKDPKPVSLVRQAGAVSIWFILVSNVPPHPTLFISPISHWQQKCGGKSCAWFAGTEPRKCPSTHSRHNFRGCTSGEEGSHSRLVLIPHAERVGSTDRDGSKHPICLLRAGNLCARVKIFQWQH